jgi:hypothetical protein
VTAHTFTRVRPTRRTFENTYRNTYGLLLIRHPCTRIYLSGPHVVFVPCNKSALEIDDGGDTKSSSWILSRNGFVTPCSYCTVACGGSFSAGGNVLICCKFFLKKNFGCRFKFTFNLWSTIQHICVWRSSTRY